MKQWWLLPIFLCCGAARADHIMLRDNSMIECTIDRIGGDSVVAILPSGGRVAFQNQLIRSIVFSDKDRSNVMSPVAEARGISIGREGSALTEAAPVPMMSGYTPVLLAREKNPGEAALYALIGVPTLAPLGQLYNGEMSKAAGVFWAKLAAVAVVGLGYAVAALDSSASSRDSGGFLKILGGAGLLGVSVYSVADAAVSADRINRDADKWRSRFPAVSVGMRLGFDPLMVSHIAPVFDAERNE
jgi:hypothetical protein